VHIRYVTVKRKGKKHRYPQLVESYRREKDGMPAHRVIAGLSSCSDQEIENLKTALQASRKGRRVVMLPDKVRKNTRVVKPVRRNLRYLAEAVAWEMWRQSGVGEIVDELVPLNEKLVSAADVTGILVCQRCVAPASKLYAQQWFPKTALPELVGITPTHFNNTRIHRVLEELDRIDGQLQKRLASAHSNQRPAFSAMYLDVTDTWFEGRGAELAEKAKTKEGLYRHKIGIVLLCDEVGYPLRWEVLKGRTADSTAMTNIVEEIKERDWAQHVPLVVDRAMGRSATVRELLDSGLRFVTALTRNEFDSYTTQIPTSNMQKLEPLCTQASQEQDMRSAAHAANDAGMHKISENLYILDLGVIDKGKDKETSAERGGSAESTSDKTVVAMERAQSFQQMLSDGRAANHREAGAELGCSKRNVSKLLGLVKLTEDIQQAVLRGEAAGLSLQQLHEVAALPTPEQQRVQFQALLREAIERPDRRHTLAPGGEQTNRRQTEDEPLRVRIVVAFNPEMFVTQRRHAEMQLAELYKFVRDLNRRLATPQSNRSKTSVAGEVAAQLRKAALTEVLAVNVGTRQAAGRERFFVELKLKRKKWEQLRRFDGFWLLVAHPDLLDSGAELCKLYRAKDMVEKDIAVIKSVLKLRPIRHRTNPKVRAHVSLCMHGLRVNRMLEERLAQALHRPMTAPHAFETLRDVHLNQLQPEGESAAVYTVTECTREQAQILEALGLQHLANDEEMAGRITCR
jgi:transposase